MYSSYHDPGAEWTPHPNLLPFMFGEGDLKEESDLSTLDRGKKDEKLRMFEAALAYELSEGDTIETSIQKIVKVALAAEYGVHLTKEAGFKRMVSSIAKSITQDPILRKQAFIIADRFTQRASGSARPN